MASPHVAGVAALFLGAGNMYGSAQELYDDLVAHSTQNAISGLYSGDRRTTRNLLYNKLEDLADLTLIKPRDGFEASKPEEEEANVQRENAGGKKNKSKKKMTAKKKKEQHTGPHHRHRDH